MQMNLRMRGQEVFDGLTLVGREIVSDHMDFFAARLVHDDVGQEGHELGGGMPLGGLAQHLARFGVEGGVERQGAVSVILKAVPPCSAWGQRQNRIFAIQGLNMGLFIDAEHCRVRRWDRGSSGGR